MFWPRAPVTIAVPVTIAHRESPDPRVAEALARIETALHKVVLQGDAIMKANQQITEFLNELNAYTNSLSAEQVKQTAAITELQADVDALLLNQELSPEVTARLQEVSTGLAAAVSFETAQSETLAAIAAKNNDPLPEPVPVPEPPVV